MKIISVLLLFCLISSAMDDDGPAPDFPAAMNNLPNSRRNIMCMTFAENDAVTLSIKVEAFMHYRDRVASIVVTMKGENVETEINRLFFNI